MRLAALLLALVLAAALAAFLLGGPRGSAAIPAGEPAPPRDPDAPSAEPPATLAAERSALAPERALLERAAESALARPSTSFRPADLYGRVVDAQDEAPLSGAAVLVLVSARPHEGEPPLRVLATDADGRYLAPELGAHRTLYLAVEAAGHAPRQVRTRTGLDELVRLPHARPPLAVRVLRRVGRSPLADVAVRVAGLPQRWDGERLVEREERTDAQGRASLAGLAEGEDAQLVLRAPRGIEVVRYVASSALDEGEVEVLLEEEREVVLRLVELESGRALPDVRGTLWRGGPFASDGVGLVRLALDEGAFGPSGFGGVGRSKLVLDAPGWCRTSILLGPEALDGIPRDVPLTRGWSVTGQVRDAEGNPVAGARVRQGTGGCRSLRDPSDGFPGLPPGITIDDPPPPHEAQSGEDGRYRFENGYTSCHETVRFDASAEGFVDAFAELAAPFVGSETRLDFVLRRASASLVGRVLSDGAPLACKVQVDQEGGRPFADCETDDEGTYALTELLPGPARLEVRASSAMGGGNGRVLLHEAELVLAPGETRHDVSLEETRELVAGTVLDVDGSPVGGATVFVRDWESGRSTNGVRGIGDEGTTSGPDGRFEMLVADSGTSVELVALAGNVTASRDVLPGERGIELVLPATARLALDVRTPDDEPVPQSFLVLGWPAGTSRKEIPAFGRPSPVGADGLHHLELAAGSWDLELAVAAFAVAELLAVEARDGVPPVRVELREGITLTVRYESFPEALPPAALQIYEESALARALAGDSLTVASYWTRDCRLPTTAAGGTLHHLTPGTYVVHGVPEAWRLEPERFTIEPGSAPTITFRWQRDQAR